MWHRHFVGRQWEEIESLADQPMDAVPGGHFPTLGLVNFTIAKLLAAYMINVAAQGLHMEIMLSMKVDPVTLLTKPIDYMEKRKIRAVIDAIVLFVQVDLKVDVDDASTNQPHVRLQ